MFRLAQGQGCEAESLPLFVCLICCVSQCLGWHEDREVRLKGFLFDLFVLFVVCPSVYVGTRTGK